MAETRSCDRCGDDGWVELLDDDGFPVGGCDCPFIDQPWHRPFNYRGILDTPTRVQDGDER